MTRFGALAAATTCGSPLLAVYHSVPVPPVIDKQWYDAWLHLQQPVPVGSPTGSYVSILYTYFLLIYQLIIVVLLPDANSYWHLLDVVFYFLFFTPPPFFSRFNLCVLSYV